MKKIASLLMTIALASSAFAGAPSYSGKGGKVVTPPAPSCDWFAPGLKVGAFGGAYLQSSGNDDSLGGGVLAEYFFTENFGLEGSSSAYATDKTHWQFDLNLVARLPMKNSCWAPYVMAGGGFFTNSETEWTWQVGAGVDVHLTGKMGLFADGAWHFG
ncbi:MAG: porin family protein, partial [Verrucomicrobia bacterium]|nr:porin family protein [Verrucomicrobiota bacterium]